MVLDELVDEHLGTPYSFYKFESVLMFDLHNLVLHIHREYIHSIHWWKYPIFRVWAVKILIPYWQISGKFLRPFYWKTHPDQMLHIIYGLSQKNRMDEPQNWNFQKNWISFPVKRPVWRPGKLKFQKNFWMSFPWFANKGYSP